MPRIAIVINSLIKNFLAKFCLAAGGRVRAASFVGAAGVKTQPNQIIGGLRLENDRIDARFERLGISGGQGLMNCFATDSSSVKFGNIEMVAEEITGAGAVGRSGSDGQ